MALLCDREKLKKYASVISWLHNNCSPTNKKWRNLPLLRVAFYFCFALCFVRRPFPSEPLLKASILFQFAYRYFVNRNRAVRFLARLNQRCTSTYGPTATHFSRLWRRSLLLISVVCVRVSLGIRFAPATLTENQLPLKRETRQQQLEYETTTARNKYVNKNIKTFGALSETRKKK